MSASHCTSGCDSGWTTYLDQSSYPKNQCHCFAGVEEAYRGGEGARMEHDEEDDLSMVSDASSGPRHCSADHEGFSGELGRGNKRNNINKKKTKVKSREHCTNPHQSSLDDTASSSVLGSPKASFTEDANFSKNEASMDHVLDSSQGFSATNFRGRSALKNQFGLYPSFRESGGLRGRKSQ